MILRAKDKIDVFKTFINKELHCDAALDYLKSLGSTKQSVSTILFNGEPGKNGFEDTWLHELLLKEYNNMDEMLRQMLEEKVFKTSSAIVLMVYKEYRETMSTEDEVRYYNFVIETFPKNKWLAKLDRVIK